MTAADGHSCGVAGKLGAFCCGANTVGQLGNGNEGIDSYGPYPVANP